MLPRTKPSPSKCVCAAAHTQQVLQLPKTTGRLAAPGWRQNPALGFTRVCSSAQGCCASCACVLQQVLHKLALTYLVTCRTTAFAGCIHSRHPPGVAWANNRSRQPGTSPQAGCLHPASNAPFHHGHQTSTAAVDGIAGVPVYANPGPETKTGACRAGQHTQTHRAQPDHGMSACMGVSLGSGLRRCTGAAWWYPGMLPRLKALVCAGQAKMLLEAEGQSLPWVRDMPLLVHHCVHWRRWMQTGACRAWRCAQRAVCVHI